MIPDPRRRVREAFLSALGENGLVLPEPLAEAVRAVPREFFVSEGQADPYGARFLPIDCGETMPGAEQAVRLLAAIDPQPHFRILEVGTGSGYITALLARSAMHVTSLERYRRLLRTAESALQRSGITNVSLFHADGAEGYREGAPYDRVIVHAAFQAPPRAFLDQLPSNGCLLCALGEADEQQMLVRLSKVGSRFEREDLWPVRYQPIAFGVAQVL